MLIKDNKTYDLDHRAYFLRGSKTSTLLAASREGRITIIDLEDSSQNVLNTDVKIRDISFSDRQQLVSIIDDEAGNLLIMNIREDSLFWEKPPEIMTNYPETFTYGFRACHFDYAEGNFWCIVPLNDEEVEIQLRQPDTQIIIDKLTIEDPFGDSHFSFHETGRSNRLSLWIAAGQDGQQIYWLKNDHGKLICTQEYLFEDTVPPTFSPNGTEFLIPDGEEDSICRYQYPHTKLGSYEPALDEESVFDHNIGYLNEDFALVGIDRLHLLDVKEMRMIEELFIEHHEPQPASYYYPDSKEDYLCTDLSFFERLGANFVFVHRRGPTMEAKDWKSSLVVIPAEKILDEISRHLRT